MRGVAVANSYAFRYLGLTDQRKVEGGRCEEESADRVEWVKRSLKSDWRQKATSKREGKLYEGNRRVPTRGKGKLSNGNRKIQTRVKGKLYNGDRRLLTTVKRKLHKRTTTKGQEAELQVT